MMVSTRTQLHAPIWCAGGWWTAVIWVSLLCGFPPVLFSAPAPDPDQEFAIEIWLTEHGMPQNSVTALLQTRAGYIWASTYSGIAQFDGERFKVFDSSTVEGLTNSRITSLFEDTQGDIWIGHDTGDVTRFSQGKFHPALLTNRVPSTVSGLSADAAGDVWAVFARGEAIRIRDNLLIQPPEDLADQPSAVPQIDIDPEGRLLVARNGYIARLAENGYQMLKFAGEEQRPYYARLATARAGGLWMLGMGRIRRWGNNQWQGEPLAFPEGDASVVTVKETTSGRLLVGTLGHGLFIHDRALGWMNLNRSNGLPQDWIRSMIEDREHNIWIGTSGGLVLLRPRKVVMQSPPDQWQGRPVEAITQAHDGAIWATTEGAGIYRLAGNSWSHFGAEAGLENSFVWSVIEDSRSNIWAGTWGGGLFRSDGTNFVRQFDLAERGEPVTALMEFPAGTIWIGTAVGLIRWDGKQLERFASLGGAAAGDVRALAVGREGEIWIGTQGSGLGRFKDGKLQTFRREQGLPRDFILSLYQDADGTLWIGTLDRGICRYRGGRFDTISMTHGLPNNVIGHMEDDGLGNLWFNSQKGLFRVSKNDLHNCADGRSRALSPLVYGKAEGLTTLAGSSGFTPSGFRSPDGRFWFPTARGIAVVNPKAVTTNQVPPSVWIEEISVDNQRAEIRTKAPANRKRSNARQTTRWIELKPGRRQLEIMFTGISFTSPERVRFKYRLESVDAEWTVAETRRPVTYSFLPPAHYTFRVIACNSDGLWNEIGDSVEIVVLPHVWQTWWFKTVLVLAGLAAVGIGVYLESRRRLRQKLDRISRERALERERSRIAQDIHDDLGASLTRIGMLSLTTRRERPSAWGRFIRLRGISRGRWMKSSGRSTRVMTRWRVSRTTLHDMRMIF
jgi:ligand-binding sensor domain-containing protein